MAYPYQGNNTSIFPRFDKLLQEIHQGLFQDSLSSHGPSEERKEVRMGCIVPSCLPKAQGYDHLKVDFETGRLRVVI